jgi:hypothetical protein
MKSSTPSLRPFILWMIADVLALADLILRLTKDHIILDTVYIPAAVAILFTVITLVYRRRYQREQKALRASATVEEASSNGEHTATPAEDTAENTAEPPNGEQA